MTAGTGWRFTMDLYGRIELIDFFFFTEMVAPKPSVFGGIVDCGIDMSHLPAHVAPYLKKVVLVVSCLRRRHKVRAKGLVSVEP